MNALRAAMVVGVAALAATGLARAQEPPPAAAAPLLTLGPALRADGVPPLRRLPATEAPPRRGLQFVDWHPQRAEMLVLAAGAREDGGTAQLHRLREPGGRPQPLTRERHAVQRGLWEPQAGAYLVFTRDTDGDEAWRLFRLDPRPDSEPSSGATLLPALRALPPVPPVALTPPELRVSDYAFLPAGRGLVLVVETLDRHAASPGRSDEGEEGDAGRAPSAQPGARQARSELWRINPLQPELPPQVLARAPGGTHLSELRVLPGGDLALLHTTARGTRLWRHPWQGGAPRALSGRGETATTTHDDEAVLWLRSAEDDFRQLQRLDLDSGRRTRFGAIPKAELEAVAAAPAGSPPRPLALVHNEQGLSVLRLFQVDGNDGRLFRPPGLPPGVIAEIAWHPQLPLLAFNHVSPQNPGRPWVLDLERGELQPWVASGAPAAQALPEARTLRWKSFDGLEISALHQPPPAHFTGPRPVLIEIHGGPSAQARPDYLQGTPRYLVQELGMHLVQPNVRGSDGFGHRFRDLDNARRREDAVRDISSLLDHLATLPGLDTTRVVVAGGSYGGYMALAVAAAESPRILGAISRVGISNFVTLLENTESYRRDNRRLEYGDERDAGMRSFLDSISPLNRAALMKKPMFIVHGRNDPRVPWGEAQQMVTALRAQGTPVWFLTADDEGHGFTKAHNLEVLHHATVEFVQRLLQGRAIDKLP